MGGESRARPVHRPGQLHPLHPLRRLCGRNLLRPARRIIDQQWRRAISAWQAPGAIRHGHQQMPRAIAINCTQHRHTPALRVPLRRMAAPGERHQQAQRQGTSTGFHGPGFGPHRCPGGKRPARFARVRRSAGPGNARHGTSAMINRQVGSERMIAFCKGCRPTNRNGQVLAWGSQEQVFGEVSPQHPQRLQSAALWSRQVISVRCDRKESHWTLQIFVLQ